MSRWYLRSMGDHDTHRGELRPGNVVVAVCGARFTPPPIVPGGPALPGSPPDPDQICPDCRHAGGCSMSLDIGSQIPGRSPVEPGDAR